MGQEKSPRVSVGAVVFRGAEVLLIKRGKPPWLGQWSIPGGGLHYGETLIEAVAREVREETTCAVRVTGLIDVFEAMPGPDYAFPHTVMVDYSCEWVSGEPIAGDDAAAAEFVAIEEAKARLSWDETRRALAMALKMRAI